MRCALIRRENGTDVFLSVEDGRDPAAATKAGYRWLPCPPVAPPAFDPATEIVEGPSYAIGADAVTETWTKRALTAPELDARKEARIDREDKLQLDVHFDMENRVRALEGKPPVTRAQYRAALKARL